MYKAIILASGSIETGEGGKTARALLRSSAMGLIAVRFEMVICNNPSGKVPGLYQEIEEHNQEFGDSVEVRKINSVGYPLADDEKFKKGAQTLAEAQACADIMEETGASLYVLAGYMKRTTGALLKHKGLNTHPGPLQFPNATPGVDTVGMTGLECQEEVLKNGWAYSAHCVHEVDSEYDTGKIVAWRKVFVQPGDTPETLYKRVREKEQDRLPRDVEDYVNNWL